MREPVRLIPIRSEQLSAKINSFGAELHELKDPEGRSLLWEGDPAIWSGRAPVLFPIVGMLVGGQYRIGGKTYQMAKHGFARNKPFQVFRNEPNSAVLRLQADAQTRLSYPFEFQLDLSFALKGATLAVKATVRNLGGEDMPASFGFHPAFRWPLPYGLPRSEHTIQFAEAEPAPVRRMDPEGLLKPKGEPTPVSGNFLRLNDALFERDALIFDQIVSRDLLYGAEGGPMLDIRFQDLPYLGVWNKPGAKFLAIEPWHGINDTAGFQGNIYDKPGVFTMAPGTERNFLMTVTWRQS